MPLDGVTIVVLRQRQAWVYLLGLFQLIVNKGMHALHSSHKSILMPAKAEDILIWTPSSRGGR